MKKIFTILILLIYILAINIYFLPNFVNAAEEIKLNTLKFEATEVDIDKVKENSDEKVKIPTTLDFSGDIAMITVAFENEKGNKYGPVSIYIDTLGKKDLEIQNTMPLVEGTTYYLTDVYFMKKVGDGYDIQKQYVTNKSKTSANGNDVVELDYDYSFKVYSSSNINNEQKEKDETVANGVIPQTGIRQNIIIVLTIMGIAVIAIATFIAYKKTKNV